MEYQRVTMEENRSLKEFLSNEINKVNQDIQTRFDLFDKIVNQNEKNYRIAIHKGGSNESLSEIKFREQLSQEKEKYNHKEDIVVENY